MKRIALFLLTNLAIVLMLSVIAQLLGLDRTMGAHGIDLGALLTFAALFGFGGALISLAISKWSAKMAVGAHVIHQPESAVEAWLVDMVSRQARAAGIGTPEVAIYESDDVNAFATGMQRDNALVAVSSGLLRRMTRDEAEAVLAHEVSHIANGDMVTLTLIQGVVNTFVIFLSRVIGWFVDRVILKNQDGPGIGYYATFFALEIILGVLATMIVMAFSRHREFRADAGSGQLVGRGKMIAALRRLQSLHEAQQLPERVAALGISGRRQRGWLGLFASHPSLEARIEALLRNER